MLKLKHLINKEELREKLNSNDFDSNSEEIKKLLEMIDSNESEISVNIAKPTEGLNDVIEEMDIKELAIKLENFKVIKEVKDMIEPLVTEEEKLIIQNRLKEIDKEEDPNYIFPDNGITPQKEMSYEEIVGKIKEYQSNIENLKVKLREMVKEGKGVFKRKI